MLIRLKSDADTLVRIFAIIFYLRFHHATTLSLLKKIGQYIQFKPYLSNPIFMIHHEQTTNIINNLQLYFSFFVELV